MEGGRVGVYNERDRDDRLDRSHTLVTCVLGNRFFQGSRFFSLGYSCQMDTRHFLYRSIFFTFTLSLSHSLFRLQI